MTKEKDTSAQKVLASKHSNYAITTLVSVLVPVAGIIMGIIYMTKEKKLDRKLGEHLIAVGILMSIVVTAAWYFFVGPTVYRPVVVPAISENTITPLTPSTPAWDVDMAYAKISKGMARDTVEAAIQKKPASSCVEQEIGQEQKYESCTYGVLADHGIIIVTYSNGIVINMSKTKY